MSGLAAVLAGRHEPGVNIWDSALPVEDVKHAVEHAHWQFGHVDSVAMEKREEVLLAIGEALGFPEHFRGKSLDGLNDCLRDLAGPTVLLWDDWGPFARVEEQAFARICRVLERRAGAVERPTFQVLLRGPGPEVDVPVLA